MQYIIYTVITAFFITLALGYVLIPLLKKTESRTTGQRRRPENTSFQSGHADDGRHHHAHRPVRGHPHIRAGEL